MPQIREQRLMQLREDNGQYGNYSGTLSQAPLYSL